MKFGKFVKISDISQAEQGFKDLVDLGFNTCQLVYKPEVIDVNDAPIIKELLKKYNVEVSAMFCGERDPHTVYDLYYGFLTSGINNDAFMHTRLEYCRQTCEFAAALGVEDVIVHAGHVPQNPFAAEYKSMLVAAHELAIWCQALGLNLLFETGCEAPIALLRLIEDIGTGNLYINLDPANILMYGSGNPVDAIDVFGKYVRNIHGKDGCVPTNPRKLGIETPIGKGMVDFEKMLKKLHDIGYDRYITIEREGGNSIDDDILHARRYLEDIWNSLD